MARRQMQQLRTVTTPAIKTKTYTETTAITDTVTNVKQSVEIVQTLVHGSISSLLYMRKLLPASCFVERSYAAIKKDVTYEEYASGNGTRENTDPDKDPGWAFKSLRRGKSTRADRLLDWLVSSHSCLGFKHLSSYRRKVCSMLYIGAFFVLCRSLSLKMRINCRTFWNYTRTPFITRIPLPGEALIHTLVLR